MSAVALIPSFKAGLSGERVVMRNPMQCASVLLAVAMVVACTDEDITSPRVEAEAVESASLGAVASSPPFPVSGSGIFFAGTEVVLSVEPTATGLIQRSTSAGQLSGDLNGSILFNPTAVIDFQNGTVVNTGTQFFSGTVVGSDPVILHDDSFRFDIDLNTGETIGTVHLSRSIDGPDKGRWFDCDLVVVGTGVTPEGHITSDYSGECVRRGNPG
jgi:hypothetical protein